VRRLLLFLSTLGLVSLLFVALANGGATTATRDRDTPRCDNSSVRGAYGFVFDGNFSPTEEITPLGQNLGAAFSGVINYDGHGASRGVVYFNPPGTTAPDGNADGIPFTSRYQVRPDCTGYARNSINGEPASAVAFVLVDIRDGVAQALMLTEMVPGITAAGRSERIVGSGEE
jgi:hypothetical protein